MCFALNCVSGLLITVTTWHQQIRPKIEEDFWLETQSDSLFSSHLFFWPWQDCHDQNFFYFLSVNFYSCVSTLFIWLSCQSNAALYAFIRLQLPPVAAWFMYQFWTAVYQTWYIRLGNCPYNQLLKMESSL